MASQLKICLKEPMFGSGQLKRFVRWGKTSVTKFSPKCLLLSSALGRFCINEKFLCRIVKLEVSFRSLLMTMHWWYIGKHGRKMVKCISRTYLLKFPCPVFFKRSSVPLLFRNLCTNLHDWYLNSSFLHPKQTECIYHETININSST